MTGPSRLYCVGNVRQIKEEFSYTRGERENHRVDLNHPLAGKTLNFYVKVTDIKAAEAR